MAVKAYKGFEKDFTCKGFKYEEGETFKAEKAICCEAGFHACEYPLDCLQYYSPNNSLFHEVILGGDLSSDKVDTKLAATRITICRRLTISDLVKESIVYVTRMCEKVRRRRHADGVSVSTGYMGASSVKGPYGVSVSTGTKGASSADGAFGVSVSTGHMGASCAEKSHGVSVSTGYCGGSYVDGCYSISAATGQNAIASADGAFGVSVSTGTTGASSADGAFGVSVSTGYAGASAAFGFGCVSISRGYNGTVYAGAKNSVAIALGPGVKASGCIGSYLLLSDWRDSVDINQNTTYWDLIGVKLVYVDGEKIKDNTYYRYSGGEVFEVYESGERAHL